MNELIDSTKTVKDCILKVLNEIQSLNNDDPKKSILESQLSLLTARYQRDMSELFIICQHEWESHYDVNDLRYEQCTLCFNIKRI